MVVAVEPRAPHAADFEGHWQQRAVRRKKEGIFSGALVGDFDADVELPASAVATGLHREGWEIWVGDDDDWLYLVGPDRTERWQRAHYYMACM